MYSKHFKHLVAVGLIVMAVTGQAGAAQVNTYGKLEIKADDGSFSARITGRLHADGNFYNSDKKKIPSGTFIRRARIGVQGNFHEYGYEIEFDNATNQANLRNANISRLLGPGTIRVGQFKMSESLEQVSSSNDIALMERPYLSQATPDYKIGVGYNGTAGAVGYSANVYNLREAADGEDRPITDGTGSVARAYFSPVNRKTMAIHIGGSFAYEVTDSSGSRVRVSPLGRAEEYTDGEEFRFELYDRRNEEAKIKRINLEGVAINGPLAVQAEYMFGSADTKTRTADDFRTWYAQVSYVLTGESREYGFRRGEIERPKPSRASGAFEIAGRYQQAVREHVTNAKLTATELGITYYANRNVRYLVNYGWTDNKLEGDQPRLLSMRAQFDF